MDRHLSSTFVLELVTAFHEENGWEHHYLKIPGDRYSQFKDAIRNGPVDLRSFGEVLHTGRGREPSARERAKLEQELRVDHEFDEKFHELFFSDDFAMGQKEEL